MVDSGTCNVGQTVFKEESHGDGHTEDRGQQMLHNGVESDENPGPSHANDYPALSHNIAEVQQQQDKLMELMQETAMERDALKEQVLQLTSQLEERSRTAVKKECSHQASQPENTEEVDYKTLFEKAKQKVDELIASVREYKTNPTSRQSEPEDIDDIALEVDSLVRQLVQANEEKDELRSQVESLKKEKAKLAAEREELRLRLQQQSEETPTTSASSTYPHGNEEGWSSNSGTHSDTLRSLIQLRRNIGQYLVPHVPALDLEQVNFECNVIDEILEQLLSTQ